MPRRSESGFPILSAGEIGAFTVCAEAWRRKYVEKQTPRSAESVREGELLHRAWVANFDEAMFLSRNAKLVIALVLLAIAMYLTVHRG